VPRRMTNCCGAMPPKIIFFWKNHDTRESCHNLLRVCRMVEEFVTSWRKLYGS
jgi:hypothetical protein